MYLHCPSFVLNHEKLIKTLSVCPKVPFKDFTYTRRGEHFEGNVDELYRDRVSMVGISVLGGNAGLEGPYELGIDEIWATNEEFSPAKVCGLFICTHCTHRFHTFLILPTDRSEE